MPLNEVMPESAGIEVEDFDQGSRQIDERETPPSGDERARDPEPDVDERTARPARAEGEDDGGEDDERASEAARELNERKRSLAGRKRTIQGEINELVRQRGDLTRQTQRERDEYIALTRDIERLRETRRRLSERDGSDPVEDERRAGDPREFNPRRPPARDEGLDPNDPRPREEDFRDYAEYTEGLARWGAREEVRRAEARREQRERMSQRERWEAQRQEQYSQRYKTFAKDNPTFEEEINRDDLFLSAPMVDAIKGSEVGPAMLLWLARHPDHVDRIAAMPPVLAFGEMKKIEARLEDAHSGSSREAQQHSNARPPIKPVERASSREVSDTDVPDDSVSEDEHIERMNKRDELLRKRGINTRKSYGTVRR